MPTFYNWLVYKLAVLRSVILKYLIERFGDNVYPVLLIVAFLVDCAIIYMIVGWFGVILFSILVAWFVMHVKLKFYE